MILITMIITAILKCHRHINLISITTGLFAMLVLSALALSTFILLTLASLLWLLFILVLKGSLEVRLPTIWTHGKAEEGRVREEKGRRKQIREEKGRNKIRAHKKVEKPQTLCFSNVLWGSKSRLAKVRSHFGRWEMKNCTPLWREALLEVKMPKTPVPERFWEFRIRKSVRRCGAKHFWKSKWQNTCVGALLEVQMSKKCTLLWHEAHFPSQNV